MWSLCSWVKGYSEALKKLFGWAWIAYKRLLITFVYRDIGVICLAIFRGSALVWKVKYLEGIWIRISDHAWIFGNKLVAVDLGSCNFKGYYPFFCFTISCNWDYLLYWILIIALKFWKRYFNLALARGFTFKVDNLFGLTFERYRTNFRSEGLAIGSKLNRKWICACRWEISLLQPTWRSGSSKENP